MTTVQPTNPKFKVHWFQFTPGKLLVVLLALEVILLLSEHLEWFAFNENKGYTVLITIASVALTMVFMLFWFVLALIFHWHFQFSIRSLLVLTIVVAIPCSWFAVEMKWAREQREAVEAMKKPDVSGNSVQVFYDYQATAAKGFVWGKPPGADWLQRLLGIDFFSNVTWVKINNTEKDDHVSNTELDNLKFLSHVEVLLFGNYEISDTDLEHLKGLNQLQILGISSTRITDNGLKHLEELKQLRSLSLHGTNITSNGIKHLKNLTQLWKLDLSHTNISDSCLEILKEHHKLKEFHIYNTKVTDSGVDDLRKEIPNLIVF